MVVDRVSLPSLRSVIDYKNKNDHVDYEKQSTSNRCSSGESLAIFERMTKFLIRCYFQ